MDPVDLTNVFSVVFFDPAEALKEIKDLSPDEERTCVSIANHLFKGDLFQRIKDSIGPDAYKSCLVWLGACLKRDRTYLMTARILAAKVLWPMLDQIDALKTTVKTMNIVKENNVSNEELKHEEKAAQEDRKVDR